VNFEETLKYFRRARVTGIPVRREFFGVGELPQKEDPARTVRLLVFGGSQGARIFNEVMPRIAKGLMGEVPGLRILHQAGAKFAEPVEAAYGASGADATRWEVAAFLDDMPRRFAEADLILCRSGASTVAELAAAGKAAVLVPLPTAADNHQLRNAEVFEAAGAAELRVQSSDAAMESFLSSDLAALLLDSARRREMSRKVRGLAHPGCGAGDWGDGGGVGAGGRVRFSLVWRFVRHSLSSFRRGSPPHCPAVNRLYSTI